MLPPSGQMGSAGSGGYWLWGDRLGWPASEPACRPYCPHRSRSQSPWSPGSNLPSRGTQTPSLSPEACGLDDKIVNSSPRVCRKCSPSVQSFGLSIPHAPGEQGRKEMRPIISKCCQACGSKLTLTHLLPVTPDFQTDLYELWPFQGCFPIITTVIWHSFTLYFYPTIKFKFVVLKAFALSCSGISFWVIRFYIFI